MVGRQQPQTSSTDAQITAIDSPAQTNLEFYPSDSGTTIPKTHLADHSVSLDQGVQYILLLRYIAFITYVYLVGEKSWSPEDTERPNI